MSSYDGPIDPSTYRSWLFVKHNNEDRGERQAGWAEHNMLFEIDRTGDQVNLSVVFANTGWGNAPIVNVDIFVPVGNEWLVKHKQALSFESGEERREEYSFTAGPGYAEDSEPPSFQPSVVLRICDLFTPVPTQAEIVDCLMLFGTDSQRAIDRMRRWKQMPGFFVYPCCALFTR